MDTYPTQPPDRTPQTDSRQGGSYAPQAVPTDNVADVPKQRGRLRSHKAWTVTAAVVVLLVLGVLSPHKHHGVPGAANNATNSTSSDVAQLVPVHGLSSSRISSSAPVNEKTYFNTVWTHLDTIGKLSESMNVSCSVKFAPPEPCASDIQAFQSELLKTKADLDQVSAPASFATADATLRSALNADIRATVDAQAALRAESLTKWLVAVNEHAVAGKQLNLAGTQALDVLN